MSTPNEDSEALALARKTIEDKKRDSIDTYQSSAGKFAQFPQDKAWEYLSLGITSESGEIASKVKKVIRDKDGIFSDEDKSAIAAEIGDVIWYAAMLASHVGVKMSDVLAQNIEKLQSRLERNVIAGSGDNR
jgi:NTP pyrophosphatase (non-canonical NTP hydrolase)